MKKLVLAIAIVMGVSAANAQEIRFGAKAGLNMSNVNVGNLPDGISDELKKASQADQRMAYFVGVMAEIPLTDQFSFQPELLYSSQGSKREFSMDIPGTVIGGGKFTTKTVSKLDYINIPLMAKYYVMPGLAIEAGPQVGFLIGANATASIESTNELFNKVLTAEQKEKTTDIKDNFNSLDYGVNLGASYTISNINIGARYNLGLADLTKYPDGVDKPENAPTQKNGVIQVSVGYFF